MGNRTPAALAIGALAAVTLPAAARAAIDNTGGQTTTTTHEAGVPHGYLHDEVWGLKPQLGSVIYKGNTNSTDTRFLIGFSGEANFIRSITPDFYVGPSTGLLYTHQGPAGDNFFGGGPALTAGDQGANMLIIPLDIKAGYQFPHSEGRISLRFGGNIIYRSFAAAAQLSQGDLQKTSASTDGYPNVGADFEFGALMVRLDWTIAPQHDLYGATAGLVLPFGPR